MKSDIHMTFHRGLSVKNYTMGEDIGADMRLSAGLSLYVIAIL